MSIALPETLPDKAKDITDAKIGPTQGVQTSPKLKPMRNPAIKSERVALFSCILGVMSEEIFEKNCSSSTWILPKSILKPNVKTTTTETNRSASGET